MAVLPSKPSGASRAPRRFGPTAKVAAALFGIALLAVAVVAGTGWTVATAEGERSARRAVGESLGASQAAQTAFQQQRYLRLNLISRIFATDQLLTSYLSEAARARDEAALLDALEEYQNLLSFDLAVVLDRSGGVLTRTDRQPPGEDLSTSPLVAVALEESKAAGVWRQGDGLYHAVCVPLVRQFELVGYIVVAYTINDPLALQIKRSGGADVTFLARDDAGPPRPMAGSLDAADTSALLSALSEQGDLLTRSAVAGETVSDTAIELDGTELLVSLSPLRDAAGDAVGAAVTSASLDEQTAGFSLVRTLLLLAALLTLPVILLFASVLATRLVQPTARVAEAASRAADGDYEAEMPSVGGEAGRISKAIDRLLQTLRERQEATFAVNRLARFLPEPARAVAQTRPTTVDATLVGIDLRRFADPKIGYDPEDNVSRLARDVSRIERSAESHKGRLVSLAGHRALVVFEGETSCPRAMTAATEILLTLSDRENVFDEPNPPAVAVTLGKVVLGQVSAGGHSTPAVAGVPVQRLDSLLREATPGAIFFSRPVWDVMGRSFHEQKADVKAQRGILSTQPLYLIGPEEAARVTGARGLNETTTQFPGEGKSLAEVRPGTLLAHRFEILDDLGSGGLGRSFKARDREAMDLVVLELLRPDIVHDTERLEVLKRSIAKARTVRHPNVVSVIDFGKAEELPFLTTEFVRGPSLAFLLEQAGALRPRAALRIARQIAWGLAAAHEQQLLHGALGPEAVVVEGGAIVRLRHLGVAAARATPAEPSYLAPEQVLRATADSRTDLYAWGAVTYHMLTGQPPMPGASIDAVRSAMETQDPAPVRSLAPEVSEALEALVARCLSKSPDDRFETIGALVEALEGVRT